MLQGQRCSSLSDHEEGQSDPGSPAPPRYWPNKNKERPDGVWGRADRVPCRGSRLTGDALFDDQDLARPFFLRRVNDRRDAGPDKGVKEKEGRRSIGDRSHFNTVFLLPALKIWTHQVHHTQLFEKNSLLFLDKKAFFTSNRSV